MKKWPPNFPEFGEYLYGKIDGTTDTRGAIRGDGGVMTGRDFRKWWNENIESLGPAKEVQGHIDTSCKPWGFHFSNVGKSTDTTRALLIGIEPLAEPSADDLLEELVNTWGSDGPGFSTTYNKARVYLEKKGRL